jgi:hypothetical protein
VKGKHNVTTYHAIMGKTLTGKIKRSPGERHFCKHCASCLWIYDPSWPEWVYPFASAIDSKLPKAAERNHILLRYAANWCEIPRGKREHHFASYPDESIADWHKRHKLYKK